MLYCEIRVTVHQKMAFARSPGRKALYKFLYKCPKLEVVLVAAFMEGFGLKWSSILSPF